MRREAIGGLAARGDRSVLPALERELRGGMALRLLYAATALAAPELCGALAAAAADGLTAPALHGPYDLTSAWEDAMRACGCRCAAVGGPGG